MGSVAAGQAAMLDLAPRSLPTIVSQQRSSAVLPAVWLVRDIDTMIRIALVQTAAALQCIARRARRVVSPLCVC